MFCSLLYPWGNMKYNILREVGANDICWMNVNMDKISLQIYWSKINFPIKKYMSMLIISYSVKLDITDLSKFFVLKGKTWYIVLICIFLITLILSIFSHAYWSLIFLLGIFLLCSLFYCRVIHLCIPIYRNNICIMTINSSFPIVLQIFFPRPPLLF